MFSGFQMIDGFRRNMFNNVPSKITDKKTIGAGYPFLWLRADAGITKDENDYVSEWKDKDGRDYAFVQDTLANKPLWVANANGQNGVLFDGSDDQLRMQKEITFRDMFVVFNWGGSETLYPHYDGILTNYVSGGYNTYMSTYPNTTNLNVSSCFYLSSVWVDNKYQKDLSPIQNFHIANGQSLNSVTHDDFLLGNDRNVDRHWKGHISEMLLFKKHLTAEQTNYWANYLATRYNITLQA